MRLSNCRQCNFFVGSIADSTLCRFAHETSYRAVYQQEVVSCPRDKKK